MFVTHLIYGPTSIEMFISLCCFSYTSIVNYVIIIVTGLTLQFCNVKVYRDIKSR